MIKEQGLWPLLMKKLKWLYAFLILLVSEAIQVVDLS